MATSSKIIILLCCFFVFAFKVSAANTYISNGIKIAQFDDQLSKIALEKTKEQKNKLLEDHVKSLNLMAHVLGNVISIESLFLCCELPKSFNSIPPSFIKLGLTHPIDKPPQV